jgi:hypothetical protein
MSEDALPREVRDLVARRLCSMEEIEILLLLASAPRSLTVEGICAGLRISMSSLPTTSIRRLIASDLVVAETAAAETSYRYAPATPELRAAVALLAVAYDQRPVTLIRHVYHREAPAQTFADVFPPGERK